MRLYVSVGTVAGRGLALEKLAGLNDGVFYLPIDYAFAVRRVLRRPGPPGYSRNRDLACPVPRGQAHRCRFADCQWTRVRSRVSPLPRRARFFRQVLRYPDAIFVQTAGSPALHRSRRAAGKSGGAGQSQIRRRAVPQRSAGSVAALLDRLKPATVWIAASTMPGVDSGDVDEDDAVIGAFQSLARIHAQLLLILVPRKPEQFSVAEEKLRAAGVRYLRRSDNRVDPCPALPCVLLLDTIGELASLFPLADVVFMGGSLAHRAVTISWSPLPARAPSSLDRTWRTSRRSPLSFARTIVLGNRCADELGPAVSKLIEDSQLRDDLGAGAAQLAAKHGGATAKALDHILKWRDWSVPRSQPYGPMRPLLWSLSKIWAFAGGASTTTQCCPGAPAERPGHQYRWHQYGRSREDSHGGLSGGAIALCWPQPGYPDPRLPPAVHRQKHPDCRRHESTHQPHGR